MDDLIKFSELMEEIKAQDSDRYNKIKENSRKKVEAIKKKRGGAPPNAGRKKSL